MKTSRLMALAAMLCASAASPALADWDHVGSVDVGGRHDRDSGDMGRHHDRDAQSGRYSHTFELGGPVSRLQLRADSNVNCDSVSATFANGDARDIFSGRLREGRAKNVYLPGRLQHITRLNFDCQARDRDGAKIEILADVGRYREDWQRGPNWQQTWAHVFNWGSNEINHWKYLGEESFEGRNDSETAFAGWQGRGSDAVALMPTNANARCSQVKATFDNGNSQVLAIHNGDYMSKGMYYKLDLPGDRRNIASLSMRCRATDARRVTIQIFTSK